MHKIICLIALAAVFSACDPITWVKQQMQPESAPQAPAPAPAASVAAEASPQPAGRGPKANAELLREMVLVVFMREPKDRGEFGNMVDSMNQGASLEGVYNGFTHSAAYRTLEKDNPKASKDAVKVFAEELAILEQELPSPTAFSEESAKPLAASGDDSASESGVTVMKFPPKASPAPTKLDVNALAAQYMRIFSGASIFTLKRVLADEALKVIQAKKADKQGLAAWYGKWVTRIAGRKVDFGIPQRNNADEQFHTKWALAADEDSLCWEVLNRIHRVENDANGKKS